MYNYYEILSITPHSSIQEIKRSFRRKAKEIHPDLHADAKKRSEEKMKLLLTAYKVLINPEKRKQYDRVYKNVYSRCAFDYREYLKRKKDDYYSQAKLVFYDLLKFRREDAINLYNSLFREGFELENYLSRADYMDCAFLLAESFADRGEYVTAYELYKKIYLYELKEPYFHHFIDEVIDRLREIVCFKMIGAIETDCIINYLHDLIEFNFSNKDTAFFYKKIAEVYSDAGNNEIAVIYLEKGLNLNHKLSGVKKLKEKIGYPGAVSLQNT